MAFRVGVIGGGFSGLTSALLLERAMGLDVEVTIFEASQRLGGRVLTRTFEDSAILYDAGAAEFYDITESPRLGQLVHSLGLSTTPMTATPCFVSGDLILWDEEDFRRYLGGNGFRELSAFWERGIELRPPKAYACAGQLQDNDHPWSSVLFSEVLAGIRHETARRFTEFQVHSDVATEPHLTNGIYGFDNLLIDHPGYCSMYTIDGGNECLIHGLAERIRARVRLSTPVLAVAPLLGGGFSLTFPSGDGGVGDETFDAIISTLTPIDLLRLHWDDPELRGRVREHALHHFYPTDYVRVSVLFHEPFWKDQFPEDYFVSSAFGGVTVYDKTPKHEHAEYGLLSWLVGGAEAARAANTADAHLLDEALSSLPPGLPDARSFVRSSRIDRWTGGMGVSRLPGGLPLLRPEQRHTPDPRLPNLLMAGDYLYDATLCGALDGVLYTAGRLLQQFAGNNAPSIDDVWNATIASELGSCALPFRSTGNLCFLREAVSPQQSPQG